MPKNTEIKKLHQLKRSQENIENSQLQPLIKNKKANSKAIKSQRTIDKIRANLFKILNILAFF